MTLAEHQAALTKVNTAIDSIVDGKLSASAIAGRSASYLDLGQLQLLRQYHERAIACLTAATTGVSRSTVVAFRSEQGRST